ncbi:hypothetical protein H8356DRAFT_932789 [Neocallimastix lanati (nom. inval.)]|nr:hypothetical protein H8356DRAFT_968974 [Neocallimastix sp. JGI-2020a]KAG4091609.1 hypothetical protein H8356DRAFT_603578 [Neocallimastix sp. JGI-2020a]KAG4101538.1 hypothetical protein H8356DRAFT_932789 [Neocallimastix sp. JGI-2020a]
MKFVITMVKITKIPNIQLLLMRFKITLIYINIGLANKACISNNSDQNKNDTCIYDPIDTKINDDQLYNEQDQENNKKLPWLWIGIGIGIFVIIILIIIILCCCLH